MSANRAMAIVSIVILGLLLLAPTRWTLLTQLPTSTRTIVDNGRPVSIARTPLEHDLEAQIAVAIRQDNQTTLPMSNPGPMRWAHLIALQKQLPDQPAILATLLRLQMMSFHDDQSTRSLFTQVAAQPDRFVPNAPEYLTALEAEADDGERIAPNNAFFSFMHATILFTMGRDDDALQAIEAGGNKTEWNEYLTAEPTGSWKLADLTSHGPKSIRDLAIESAILFPHYAKLRTAANSAVYSAMLLEEKGQTDDALRIRLAVMRLGELMRSSQAQTAITALVGIAIENIAVERPAGAPMIKTLATSEEKEEAVRAQRLTEFTVYLQRTGHADAIAPVTEEIGKGQQARQIITKGLARNGDLTTFTNFGCWWLSGSVWLQNLIVLCLLVGLGSWFASRIQEPDSRKIAMALGAAVIVGTTVPFLVPTIANSAFAVNFGNALLATAIATAILCLCVARFLRNVDARKAILGMCALSAMVTATIIWPMSYFYGVQFCNLQALASFSETNINAPVTIPYGLAGSALLWIGVTIACLVRRRPVVPHATQSFVKSGRIVALAMLILYTGYAGVMTRWDQNLDRQVRERCGHEIARAAAITSQTWPPPTDFSAVKL